MVTSQNNATINHQKESARESERATESRQNSDSKIKELNGDATINNWKKIEEERDGNATINFLSFVEKYYCQSYTFATLKGRCGG